ncbi:MAG: nucleoside triphosphate pyrophosphohydrolase, partial [Bacteroidales bacterium]|nr:nucleoside triphosphate pyrophosphohydrolase [Bacteroidales bacterium]
IQEKARGVGFDWSNPEQVWEKVREELTELQNEVHGSNDAVRKEDEFGDLLFALINYARFIGVNPEDALERTNKKFIRRFRYIEDQAELHGRSVSEMSLEEMDEYWTLAKKMEGV